MLKGGEPNSVVKGAIQYYAVFAIMLLASPFTENLHFTWVLPGAALLLVIMSQEQRVRPWHAIVVATYLVLALPVTQNWCWQAGSSLAGRLSSSIDCYGLVALCAVLYHVGFQRFPADITPRSRLTARQRRTIAREMLRA
jgi:hypothetical protein